MARKRTETATDPSEKPKAREKSTTAKKCRKTTIKKFHESGKHNRGIEDKSPSKALAESLSTLDPSLIHTEDEVQEVCVLDLHSGKKVLPSKKMKLQLFPLDASTREGLEKDGFHPYLELTLSSRKKISSVLQHIHSKWGSSEVARGNPTLHPYEKPVLSSGHRWVANSNVTIGEVYEAIGAPSLFRLRYGWSSENGNRNDKPPSLSTPGIACFQNEESHNVRDKVESASFKGKQKIGLNNPYPMLSSSNQMTDRPPSGNIPSDVQVESTDNKINDGSGSTCVFWDDGLTSFSIGGLLSEVSLKGNFGSHCKNSSRGNGNATLWVDNLTNISIGGLFSEASLQGIYNANHEQDLAHSNTSDQPSGNTGGLLSEASSLAEGRFIGCNKTLKTWKANSEQSLPLMNQTNRPRALSSVRPPESTHSSILDAEDTCHAFSFRKRTTTTPKVSGETEDQQKNDSKLEKHISGSSVFNQDTSLGFSGIKWEADTRGTFDLGFSSSRNLTIGDSITFGAVVKDLQGIEPLEENKACFKSIVTHQNITYTGNVNSKTGLHGT